MRQEPAGNSRHLQQQAAIRTVFLQLILLSVPENLAAPLPEIMAAGVTKLTI
jgi:hypothetical protein